MKAFFAIVFALFLCSCSTGLGGMPNRDFLSKRGTGFVEIAHSKDYVLDYKEEIKHEGKL